MDDKYLDCVVIGYNELPFERYYGFNWFSYFRCSNSDEEAIDLMARSGCKGVFLGIESGSPERPTKESLSPSLEIS